MSKFQYGDRVIGGGTVQRGVIVLEVPDPTGYIVVAAPDGAYHLRDQDSLALAPVKVTAECRPVRLGDTILLGTGKETVIERRTDTRIGTLQWVKVTP